MRKMFIRMKKQLAIVLSAAMALTGNVFPVYAAPAEEIPAIDIEKAWDISFVAKDEMDGNCWIKQQYIGEDFYVLLNNDMTAPYKKENSAQTVSLYVLDEEGNELKEGVDYRIEEGGSSNEEGEHTAVIEPVNQKKYTGEASAVWKLVEHSHEWNIIGSGDSRITAKCTKAGAVYDSVFCNYHDDDAVSVTLRAKNCVYNGENQVKPEVQVTGLYECANTLENFNHQFSASEVSEDVKIYNDKPSWTETTAYKEAGNYQYEYTVSIDGSGKYVLRDEYSITKDHKEIDDSKLWGESWTYDGDKHFLLHEEELKKYAEWGDFVLKLSVNSDSAVEYHYNEDELLDSTYPFIEYDFDSVFKVENAGTYKVQVSFTADGNHAIESYDETRVIKVDRQKLGSAEIYDIASGNLENRYNFKEWTLIANGADFVVKVKNANDKLLDIATDYDLTGDLYGTAVENYKIKVTGKGNYSGTLIVNWYITKAAFLGGDLSFSGTDAAAAAWTEDGNAVYVYKDELVVPEITDSYKYSETNFKVTYCTTKYGEYKAYADIKDKLPDDIHELYYIASDDNHESFGVIEINKVVIKESASYNAAKQLPEVTVLGKDGTEVNRLFSVLIKKNGTAEPYVPVDSPEGKELGIRNVADDEVMYDIQLKSPDAKFEPLVYTNVPFKIEPLKLKFSSESFTGTDGSKFERDENNCVNYVYDAAGHSLKAEPDNICSGDDVKVDVAPTGNSVKAGEEYIYVDLSLSGVDKNNYVLPDETAYRNYARFKILKDQPVIDTISVNKCFEEIADDSYKVEYAEDDMHNPVSFSILGAAVTAKTGYGAKYDGTVTYQLFKGDTAVAEPTWIVSQNAISEVGEYTLVIRVAGDDNHKETIKKINIKLCSMPLNILVKPVAYEGAYNEDGIKLITNVDSVCANTDVAVIYYTVKKDGKVIAERVTGDSDKLIVSELGEYEITYWAEGPEGNDGYLKSEPEVITARIEKAQLSFVTRPEGIDVPYTGSTYELINTRAVQLNAKTGVVHYTVSRNGIVIAEDVNAMDAALKASKVGIYQITYWADAPYGYLPAEKSVVTSYIRKNKKDDVYLSGYTTLGVLENNVRIELGRMPDGMIFKNPVCLTENVAEASIEGSFKYQNIYDLVLDFKNLIEKNQQLIVEIPVIADPKNPDDTCYEDYKIIVSISGTGCLHKKMRHYEAAEPTCTEAGNREYWECAYCDCIYVIYNSQKVQANSDYIKISALGHEAPEDMHFTVDVPATCVSEGSQSVRCEVCGEKLYTESIKKTAHNYVPGRVLKAANAAEAGIQEYVCSYCGKSEARGIEPLENEKNNYNSVAGALADGYTCEDDSDNLMVYQTLSDTALLSMQFSKGKVKRLLVTAPNGMAGKLNVTVNSKVKLYFTGSGYTIENSTATKKLKAKTDKKTSDTWVKIPECKINYEFDITNGPVIYHVKVKSVGLDKNLKKLVLNTSDSSVSENVVISPVNGEEFTSGVWQVGSLMLSKLDTDYYVSVGKKNARVRVNMNGGLMVEAISGNGSMPITYWLNGRKYKTSIRFSRKEPTAKEMAVRAAYGLK